MQLLFWGHGRPLLSIMFVFYTPFFSFANKGSYLFRRIYTVRWYTRTKSPAILSLHTKCYKWPVRGNTYLWLIYMYISFSVREEGEYVGESWFQLPLNDMTGAFKFKDLKVKMFKGSQAWFQEWEFCLGVFSTCYSLPG